MNQKNAEQKPNAQTCDPFHRNKEEQHIGHLKTQEVPIEMSNPYFQPTSPENSKNPRTIVAIANANSRPVALLYAKGHINKAQYKAAERFYIYWIQSHGDLNMSPNYRHQKIDCDQNYAHSHMHAIERKIDATNHLQTVKVFLGILGYSLVEQIVGHGQAIKDLSPSKRKQNSLADHFRDCLDLLALHWGYASPKHS
ncbi:hypothetical protein [Bartonella doshiae]|uniref:hypothetical protein n=1 Tax=Bartonella doshiae TaxID=33044 RepID=UPI0009432791|nr:hypothetical protein [Bartonella doshiae]